MPYVPLGGSTFLHKISAPPPEGHLNACIAKKSISSPLQRLLLTSHIVELLPAAEIHNALQELEYLVLLAPLTTTTRRIAAARRC